MFKKIYFAMDPNDKTRNITIPEDKMTSELLTSYNSEGYNIYQTVNTFIGNKRQDKDLAEIKSCFIDIDYPEIVSNQFDSKQRAEFLKLKYENEVITNLKKIKDLYEITPSEINVTYKGFHILFYYEEDCYFIEPETHKMINNLLNEIFGGDENARDLSRIYKVVGFKDHKYINSGKIKTLTLQHPPCLISKDVIENKLLLKFKEKSIDKIKKSSQKKETNSIKFKENIEKINSFDSMEFIIKLKEYFTRLKTVENFEDYNLEQITKILNKLILFEFNPSTYIFSEEDGASKTSGLRLELDENGIWKINDYSKKNRRGNYNFLKNWILFQIPQSEIKINKIIYSTLNLTTNSSNKAVMDYQLIKSLFFDEFEIDTKFSNLLSQQSKKSISLNEEDLQFINTIKQKNELILKQFKQNYFKVFIGLFVYLRKFIENNTLKITQDGYYEIEWGDFLDKIYNLKTKEDYKHLKPTIKDYLIGLTDLKLPFVSQTITSSGKTVNTIERKSFLEIKFQIGGGGRGDKSCFFIKPCLANKFIFSNSLGVKNMKILNHQKGFKNLQPTYFHDKIYTVLNNFKNNVYIESFENCFKILELESPNEERKLRTLKGHLKEGVKNNYYGDFEIDKKSNQIKVFKYKQIKKKTD